MSEDSDVADFAIALREGRTNPDIMYNQGVKDALLAVRANYECSPGLRQIIDNNLNNFKDNKFCHTCGTGLSHKRD